MIFSLIVTDHSYHYFVITKDINFYIKQIGMVLQMRFYKEGRDEICEVKEVIFVYLNKVFLFLLVCLNFESVKLL